MRNKYWLNVIELVCIPFIRKQSVALLNFLRHKKNGQEKHCTNFVETTRQLSPNLSLQTIWFTSNSRQRWYDISYALRSEPADKSWYDSCPIIVGKIVLCQQANLKRSPSASITPWIMAHDIFTVDWMEWILVECGSNPFNFRFVILQFAFVINRNYRLHWMGARSRTFWRSIELLITQKNMEAIVLWQKCRYICFCFNYFVDMNVYVYELIS